MANDSLSLVFSALADPTRRAILARLALGPQPVKDIAQPFSMTGPAVAKHLKVLERAGLIGKETKAQQRPRRLEPAPLHEAQSWIESYKGFWEQSFDRLDSYLAEIQGTKDVDHYDSKQQ